MTEPLQLILEANIKTGREDAFQNVVRTMPDSVRRDEPDTLDFRWVRQEGTDRILFLDLYASSEAFVRHFQNVQAGGHLDALMQTCEFTATHCIGTPSNEARRILEQFGAVYYTKVAGFSRLPQFATATATR